MTSLRNNRSWSEPPASERDCCLRVETFRLEASEIRTSVSSRTEQQSRTKDSCAKRRLPLPRRSRHFLGAWLPGMAPSIPPPNWSFPRPLFVIPAPHFVVLANAGIQRGGEEEARSAGACPQPGAPAGPPRHVIPAPHFVILANAGIQRGGEEEACSAGACPPPRTRRPPASPFPPPIRHSGGSRNPGGGGGTNVTQTFPTTGRQIVNLTQ